MKLVKFNCLVRQHNAIERKDRNIPEPNPIYINPEDVQMVADDDAGGVTIHFCSTSITTTVEGTMESVVEALTTC